MNSERFQRTSEVAICYFPVGIVVDGPATWRKYRFFAGVGQRERKEVLVLSFVVIGYKLPIELEVVG